MKKTLFRTESFTIIELMMVVVLIAILAAVAVTDYNNSAAQTKLQAGRFRLISDLIYAQSLAVTQQVNCGIIFYPSAAGGGYSVYRQSAGNIAKNPLTQNDFTINYASDPALSGVALISAAFGSPSTNRVEFNNMGAPSDGSVVLAADGTVTLSCRGQTATVTVTKNTGRAY